MWSTTWNVEYGKKEHITISLKYIPYIHTTTTKKFYKERSGSGMGIGGFRIRKKGAKSTNVIYVVSAKFHPYANFYNILQLSTVAAKTSSNIFLNLKDYREYLK
jgi:hypothetical protein